MSALCCHKQTSPNIFPCTKLIEAARCGCLKAQDLFRRAFDGESLKLAQIKVPTASNNANGTRLIKKVLSELFQLQLSSLNRCRSLSSRLS
jgi:hypothetical protein